MDVANVSLPNVELTKLNSLNNNLLNQTADYNGTIKTLTNTSEILGALIDLTSNNSNLTNFYLGDGLPAEKSSTSSKTAIIVCSIVGFLLLLFALYYYCCWPNTNKTRSRSRSKK